MGGGGRLPMGALARLAWRNLWRNRRRTTIMLLAIATGAWAMIFMTALMRGMVDEMVRDGIRAIPGHLQLQHPAFRDDPSVENRIAAPSGELRAVLDGPLTTAWGARLRLPAMISSEYDNRGVLLLGVDPAQEIAIGFDAEDIVEGRFLEGPDDDGVVIGRKLADQLETRLGKRVVLMTQDPDNQVADRGFRVVGIYRADFKAIEEKLVYAGRGTLQALLGLGDEVSEIAVYGHDYRALGPLEDALRAAAPGNVRVSRWDEVDSYLAAMVDVMDGFVLVWVIVVFLALSFGLVNTIMMAVFERVREIGLMQALGMRPSSILYQVLVESVLLVVLGLAIGNLLAVATVWPLRGGIDLGVVAEGLEMFGADSVLYPKLTRSDLLLANGVVLGLSIVTSLLPAWRASRYRPVEAIART